MDARARDRRIQSHRAALVRRYGERRVWKAEESPTPWHSASGRSLLRLRIEVSRCLRRWYPERRYLLQDQIPIILREWNAANGGDLIALFPAVSCEGKTSAWCLSYWQGDGEGPAFVAAVLANSFPAGTQHPKVAQFVNEVKETYPAFRHKLRFYTRNIPEFRKLREGR